MAKAEAKAPFPAPPGKKWIFCKSYRHWRSGKIINAEDYGRKAWCFLVNA